MEKKRNNPAKNLPSWRVTSEGDFWDVASRERPAILLPFGGEFQWFGSHWVVPGVYSTAKALVVDFCRGDSHLISLHQMCRCARGAIRTSLPTNVPRIVVQATR